MNRTATPDSSQRCRRQPAEWDASGTSVKSGPSMQSQSGPSPGFQVEMPKCLSQQRTRRRPKNLRNLQLKESSERGDAQTHRVTPDDGYSLAVSFLKGQTLNLSGPAN